MSKELQVCRPSGGPENHSRAPPVLGWPFGPGTLLSSAQMWVQSPPHSRGVLTVGVSLSAVPGRAPTPHPMQIYCEDGRAERDSNNALGVTVHDTDD